MAKWDGYIQGYRNNPRMVLPEKGGISDYDLLASALGDLRNINHDKIQECVKILDDVFSEWNYLGLNNDEHNN